MTHLLLCNISGGAATYSSFLINRVLPMTDSTRRTFIRRFLLASCATLLPVSGVAEQVSALKDIRTYRHGKMAQIKLKLANTPHYKVFTLSKPERLVVDLEHTKNAYHSKGLHKLGLFNDVRWALRQGNTLRLVFDLEKHIGFNSASIEQRNGHSKLTINLTDSVVVQHKVATRQAEKRNIVVVVDPGHGGKDPGATGKHGTYEKDVVLAISRMLRQKLNRTQGFKVIMTRDKDVFIPLRERVNIAHRHKADIFVSVHADACEDRSVRGSSVYILSNKGATSVMARRLAHRENNSDLIGGVSLNTKDNMLAKVLLDLSQTGTLQASTDLATTVIRHLGKVEKVLHKRVERAAFAVLKSPDIPSALVETAFISNPHEEKKLRTKAFQNKIADALHQGIKHYCLTNIPERNLIIG
ncbi:N-acetylmuramoyl-L-alanine amidase [Marinomonas pollencensis]|uniref:N-acetylmuramoyl-L-alanine amidase AmiC n=1 Tax=Marinomonas pollencensis TaxID=491954 RepID=A0A3E0DJM2_9GAMM|nr:N-acetylmuramoyl-L-alanine amidase [Marinomonas pollencensis]REG82909.1 N-acetylmuramoyl-L-alanine amidase [Marinomonas pollencensis]